MTYSFLSGKKNLSVKCRGVHNMESHMSLIRMDRAMTVERGPVWKRVVTYFTHLQSARNNLFFNFSAAPMRVSRHFHNTYENHIWIRHYTAFVVRRACFRVSGIWNLKKGWKIEMLSFWEYCNIYSSIYITSSLPHSWYTHLILKTMLVLFCSDFKIREVSSKDNIHM